MHSGPGILHKGGILAGFVVNRGAYAPLKGQIITKSHVGPVSTGLISQAKLDIEILL